MVGSVRMTAVMAVEVLAPKCRDCGGTNGTVRHLVMPFLYAVVCSVQWPAVLGPHVDLWCDFAITAIAVLHLVQNLVSMLTDKKHCVCCMKQYFHPLCYPLDAACI